MEPGQAGYKPKFELCFEFEEWCIQKCWLDRHYEAGEKTGTVGCSFGWKNDNVAEATQWLIENHRSQGFMLENVKFLSIRPWAHS